MQHQVEETIECGNCGVSMFFEDVQKKIGKELRILECLQLILHEIVNDIRIEFVVFLKEKRV